MDKIDHISLIRTKNNNVWMRVLALALKAAPDETRALLREIIHNDQEVTRMMGEIANEEAGK